MRSLWKRDYSGSVRRLVRDGVDEEALARAVNVDTSASVVTLRGNVASKYQRDRALRLARETIGVARVVDRLYIK